MFQNFFSENRAVNEKMWKNNVTGQATDDNMAHTCYVWGTYGDKHIQYVIPIAFPLQHWLQERASVLRCMCTRVNKNPSA